MNKSILSLLLILTITVARSQDFPYKLNKPEQKTILPATLHEVSGITIIDSTTVACIQDENGILYNYNLKSQKVISEKLLLFNGDYEGLAKVNNLMYILRSDGILFEIADYNSPNFKINSFTTGIPATNNEGLCFDIENNRLLIAAKSQSGAGHEFKDRRDVFSFDLKTKQVSATPVFTFDVNAIKKFATKNKIKLPVRVKKNGKSESILKFRTSEIAIHPITKQLYLLSAADHMLFIFDLQGNIQHIEVLDADLFNKSEGIDFFKNGDMLITNEGQDKKPTLLRFDYRN